MKATSFQTIADRIAADIAAGRLRPGARLMPQRRFALHNNVAVSTAIRVYTELRRRGLVEGEVGRGTYVLAGKMASGVALVEPSAAPVDLELIFPLLPEHATVLADALAKLAKSPSFAEALRPIGAAATPAARAIASTFLARDEWRPDPDCILFAGNGRQAIAAVFAAIAKAGDRIGVEPLTYPVAKGIAARLGITLVPLATDDSGVVPDAISKAHRRQPLTAVYLQPSLHSPTAITMPEGRRVEIAKVLRRHDLVAIEDGVYTFLVDDRPLATFAPDHVIFIDSLSKRIAPGLTVGLIAATKSSVNRIASALRSGAWSASGLPIAAGLHWMTSNATAKIVETKRRDALARRALATEVFRDFGLKGDVRSYHLWLPLPEPWRAETFAAASLRHGISVTPGSAFAVAPGHAPAGIRLALASPEQATLLRALRTLRDLALGFIDSAPQE